MLIRSYGLYFTDWVFLWTVRVWSKWFDCTDLAVFIWLRWFDVLIRLHLFDSDDLIALILLTHLAEMIWCADSAALIWLRWFDVLILLHLFGSDDLISLTYLAEMIWLCLLNFLDQTLPFKMLWWNCLHGIRGPPAPQMKSRPITPWHNGKLWSLPLPLLAIS